MVKQNETPMYVRPHWDDPVFLQPDHTMQETRAEQEVRDYRTILQDVLSRRHAASQPMLDHVSIDISGDSETLLDNSLHAVHMAKQIMDVVVGSLGHKNRIFLPAHTRHKLASTTMGPWPQLQAMQATYLLMLAV